MSLEGRYEPHLWSSTHIGNIAPPLVENTHWELRLVNNGQWKLLLLVTRHAIILLLASHNPPIITSNQFSPRPIYRARNTFPQMKLQRLALECVWSTFRKCFQIEFNINLTLSPITICLFITSQY